MAIWIDVSTIMDWNRIVGIVRCELELVRYIAEMHDSEYKFVRFERGSSKPVKLNGHEVRTKIEHLLMEKSNKIAQPDPGALPTVKSSISDRVRALITGHDFSRRILMLPALLVAAGIRFSIESSRSAVALTREFKANVAYESHLRELKKRTSTARKPMESTAQELGEQNHDGVCWGNFFNEDDTLVSIGLTWDYINLSTLQEEKRAHNFRFIGMCYDLIPVDLPHLVPDFYGPFIQKYLENLVNVSDHIFCISSTTKQDLANFINREELPDVSTSVVYLGDDISPESKFDGLPEILLKEQFMVFVSTLEPRKNHDVLYKAFLHMERNGLLQKMPMLLFVGMQGWNSRDFYNLFTSDPRVNEKIIHLPEVTDLQLSWLYDNCLFTVYPSQYEGWGLPIGESLARGVPALISTSPACVEASQGLAKSVDYLNPIAWAESISELVMTPNTYLEAKKSARLYAPNKWSTFAETICSHIL